MIKVVCGVSLIGFEFVVGIFGSVGGVIFMNVGVYGGEMSEVVEMVMVLMLVGQFKILDYDELDFGYWYSMIQDYDDIVVLVMFGFKLGNQIKI